ncbi:MAG TPA: sensor histidine kinase [Ktedonobacterales bacterium]|nr:sensor histidine kinase [Ktedonobacterales bacterium]
MSSELERLSRSNRRVLLFWLLVSVGLLTYCLVGAFTDEPTMLYTWRGAALILLSGGYLTWYAAWALKHARKRQVVIGSWPIPWRTALFRWGCVFATISLMTALSPMMGWMFWASFGMALGIFRLPLALLPAGLSIAGVFYALIVTEQPPVSAIIWIAISMGLGILSVGYTTYTASRLMRERVEREHVFNALEDAHRQLADAHRQLELSAEREAELAVLSERSRLAREMHDTIGHALVLIAVKLEAAQRLRAVNPERADHEIDVTKEIVRSTMSEMRASLANLRSPITTRQSIAEMLARRARESSERAGFRVTYQMPADLGEIDTPIREALYRIGAEALTNIEKHAQARMVTLSLARCEETITLQIEDDGVGLPALIAAGPRAAETQAAPSSSPPGHYGITGMRERAEALGGRLSLRPRVGGGTMVEVSIPLPAALN